MYFKYMKLMLYLPYRLLKFCFHGGIIFFPVSRFPKPSSILSDLKVVCGDKDQLSALVHLFENHIGKEWFEPWDSFNWVVNNL